MHARFVAIIVTRALMSATSATVGSKMFVVAVTTQTPSIVILVSIATSRLSEVRLKAIEDGRSGKRERK